MQFVNNEVILSSKNRHTVGQKWFWSDVQCFGGDCDYSRKRRCVHTPSTTIAVALLGQQYDNFDNYDNYDNFFTLFNS